MEGKFWYIFDNIEASLNEAEILLYLSLPQSYGRNSVSIHSFFPEPSEIVTDDYDLNRVAIWRIKDIKRKDISISYTFDLEESKTENKGVFSESERKRFLISEHWVTLTSDIKKLAKVITKDIKNEKEKAFFLFEWTVENIKYEYPDVEHRGTTYSFKARKGDCGEFSVIYCALCRSIGIPARTVTCLWLDFSGHQWAEIYIDGEGWIPVDTSLAKELKYPYSIITDKVGRDRFIEKLGLKDKEYTYLFGNSYNAMLVVFRGNNNEYVFQDHDFDKVFVYMQPGGMSSVPNGYEFRSLNEKVVQGGLIDLDNQPWERVFRNFRKRYADRYLQNGLDEEGIEGLQLRLKDNSHDAEALFYLGSAFFEKRQYSEAEKYLEESLQLPGGGTKSIYDTWANIQLGNIKDIRNQRSKAIDFYNKALLSGIDYSGSLAMAKKHIENPYKESK